MVNLKTTLIVSIILILITITSAFSQSMGDVNNDSVVNIVDALLVAQEYVNLDPPALTNPENADVNCDRTIDIVDALLIAQYDVGLVPAFEPCDTTPSPTPIGPTGTPLEDLLVFAVNCGGSAYTSSDGTDFVADTNYSGGTTYSNTNSISGTSDETLYQSERYGDFTYTIPVSNSLYRVTQYNAETYHTSTGSRSFDVLMEGTAVITNLDLYAEVGGNAAYVTETEVSVTDGELTIQYTTNTDNAKICAIKVSIAGPGASFSYSPGIPVTGQSVSFDASSSTDPVGTITDYSWDFGDGYSGTGIMVTHTYSTAGDYDVTLTVSDDQGYSGSQTQTLSVYSGDPVAEFSINPTSVKPGDTVTVDASASFDPDGTINSYRVDYGDGTIEYGAVTTHQYSNEGDFTITVTVTDNDNQTDSLSKTINVTLKTKFRLIWSSDFPPIPVTNSDPDDVQTFIRLLLYSNELDIEGFIAAAGTYNMVANKSNILEVLDKYDQVDENLRKHDPDYPTADHLRSITYQGLGNEGNISISWTCGSNWGGILGQGRDSEGSEAIIAAADKDDPRPLWIGVAGGPREVSQAIWKVRNTRSQSEIDKFISKLRVFMIYCQDDSHGYIMDVPNLFVVESKSSFGGFFCNSGNTSLCDKAWLNQYIYGHGALCDIYPDHGSVTDGVQEGDTPAFLHLISADPSRLGNNPEIQSQPSWGGEYVHESGTNHWLDGPGGGTINQWRADYQAEFAERADWCVD